MSENVSVPIVSIVCMCIYKNEFEPLKNANAFIYTTILDVTYSPATAAAFNQVMRKLSNNDTCRYVILYGVPFALSTFLL